MDKTRRQEGEPAAPKVNTDPAQVLDALRDPWILDVATRQRCEPLIRDRLAAGWTPDALLKTLTDNPAGIEKYGAVFYVRLKGLPERPVTKARAMRSVPVERCTKPGHRYENASACRLCASEAKAADGPGARPAAAG